MSNARAKTIQLLLDDGTLNGLINIADSEWNPGEMYASPRKAVNELVALDKYGIYLLLSDERVYIGRSQDLKRKMEQHMQMGGLEQNSVKYLMEAKNMMFQSLIGFRLI